MCVVIANGNNNNNNKHTVHNNYCIAVANENSHKVN